MFDWTKYLNKNGKLNGNLTRKFILTEDYIKLLTVYPWTKSISEIYYCDKNNIIEQPKCYCGEFLKYWTNSQKYSLYCSNRCVNKSPIAISKRNQTNLIKYGVINPFSDERVKEKIKATNIIKYGYDNPAKSPIVYSKIKQTNIEKYGVENVIMYPPIKDKANVTNIRKYGTLYHAQTEVESDAMEKLQNFNWLKHQHHILQKPLYKISEELGVSYSLANRYAHKHNIEVLHFQKSQGEIELYEYIKSLTTYKIEINNRTILDPYELDIYIPELNLAFEYDGEHWHQNTKEKDRWKSFECHKQGITLYHIWERYWTNNRNTIEMAIYKITMKYKQS